MLAGKRELGSRHCAETTLGVSLNYYLLVGAQLSTF
jgi:hypothetical protein